MNGGSLRSGLPILLCLVAIGLAGSYAPSSTYLVGHVESEVLIRLAHRFPDLCFGGTKPRPPFEDPEADVVPDLYLPAAMPQSIDPVIFWRLAKQASREGSRRVVALARLLGPNPRIDSIRPALETLGGDLVSQCRALNDQGAALVVTFAEQGRIDQFFDAGELFDQSVETGSCVEGFYNRAVWSENLGLFLRARDSWSRVAELDRDAVLVDWARRRAQHLDRLLDLQTLSPPPESAPTRRSRIEKALGDWAVAQRERRVPASVRSLEEGEREIALLSPPDPVLEESLEMARFAVDHPNDERSQAFVLGMAAFQSAFGAGPYSTCGADLSAASSALLRARAPFRLIVRIDEAICAYLEPDYLRAERIARELLDSESEWVRARIRWILALVLTQQGRLHEAAWLIDEAQRLYQELGDAASENYLGAARARVFEIGGASNHAWQERLRLAKRRVLFPGPERVHNFLEELHEAASRSGRFSLALAFLAEQERTNWTAKQTGRDAGLAIFTELEKADLLRRLGRDVEARETLRTAERTLLEEPSGNTSFERQGLELALQKALLDPRTDEVLPIFEEYASYLAKVPHEAIETLRLFELRTDLLDEMGKRGEAFRQIKASLDIVERLRSEIEEPAARALFLQRAAHLYEKAAGYALESSDRIGALFYIERAASQGPSAATTSLATPEAVANWLSEIPEEVLVVRLSQLSDRLLQFVMSRDRIEVIETDLGAQETASLTSECVEALQDIASSIPEPCRRLGEGLVPPAQHLPATKKTLLLVPDASHYEIPFGILQVPSTETRLVERLSLTVAPQLPLPTKRVTRLDARSKIVIVADPAFDQDLWRLPRLPAARNAVEEIAALYRYPVRFSEAEATEAHLRANLPGVEILHFEGHGITNYLNPELNGLLLAATLGRPDSTGADGLLTAGDLESLDLKALKLVVLGGCRTTLAAFPGSRETSGLAAALLRTGVGEVLVSTAPVDDEAAATFFKAFHEQLSTGIAPGEALRQTQLSLMHTGKIANEWSSFVLVSTTFPAATHQ